MYLGKHVLQAKMVMQQLPGINQFLRVFSLQKEDSAEVKNPFLGSHTTNHKEAGEGLNMQAVFSMEILRILFKFISWSIPVFLTAC